MEVGLADVFAGIYTLGTQRHFLQNEVFLQNLRHHKRLQRLAVVHIVQKTFLDALIPVHHWTYSPQYEEISQRSDNGNDEVIHLNVERLPETVVESVLKHTRRETPRDDETQGKQNPDHSVVRLVFLDHFYGLLVQVALEGQRPNERRKDKQQSRKDNHPRIGLQNIVHYRFEERESDEHQGQKDGRIEHGTLHPTDNEIFHSQLVTAFDFQVFLLAAEKLRPTFGHFIVDPIVERFTAFYQIRCEESRDDGHRNDDGIKEVVDHAETHTHRGDDERKLADLPETHSGAHGVVEVVARKQHTHARSQRLKHHHGHRNDQNLPPILHQNGRIDHHTHRHEKHRSEQVLDGCGEFVNHLSLKRFGQDAAHNERAQGRRETGFVSQPNHKETKAHGKHRQRFFRHKLARPFQDGRDEKHAADIPHQKEENKAQNAE